MKKLLAILLICFPTLGFAGSAEGLIDVFVVHYDGANLHKFDVSLEGNTSDQPSGCNNGEFWGDLTTDAGKAQYSMLLAAAMANTPVHVAGQSTCYQGREALRNVKIKF